MNIGIGKTYKTRDQNFVTIRTADDDGRFFGDIVDSEGLHVRIASFSPSGVYSTCNRISQFDILAEV